MITFICLWHIGTVINAPTWYYILVGIKLFVQLCSFGLNMYKKGAKEND